MNDYVYINDYNFVIIVQKIMCKKMKEDLKRIRSLRDDGRKEGVSSRYTALA